MFDIFSLRPPGPVVSQLLSRGFTEGEVVAVGVLVWAMAGHAGPKPRKMTRQSMSRVAGKRGNVGVRVFMSLAEPDLDWVHH
jgi:hypothetical protein